MSSSASSTSQDLLSTLTSSNNNIAAGIGETLSAVATALSQNAATGPIMIDFGDRTIALGRKRMSAMTGRNAFLYLKSKYGLLNATTPLYLQAIFVGNNKWVEVDMDAWEELVPYVTKLRIMT